MLKYLIDTTRQLAVMMMLAGIITAWLRTALNRTGVTAGRCGLILGLIGAAALTYLKNFTAVLDWRYVTLAIYLVTASVVVLYFLFSIIRLKWVKAGSVLVMVTLVLILALALMYALPDFFSYPHQVLRTEKTILSTEFLYKMIGAFFGLVLTFLLGLAVSKAADYLGEKPVRFLMMTALLIYAVRMVTSSFNLLLARRIIPSNHTIFLIAKYTSNYSDWFIYAMLIVLLVIPVVLWIRSFHVQEPYRHSAEHRQIIAKWRRIRRWSTTTLITAVLTVLSMTTLTVLANKKVELSPIEECESSDGACRVPFEQVSDGHLHRFGYETENGVVIRFIIIQKPNSSSYGIGLDACDICGETGYYEKNGQVVCNLCDVVMNINTIGFKGGCNPIVIPYDIHDGSIVVPIEGLLEYEDEFK